MKKLILITAIIAGISFPTIAQTGDLYQGMTRSIPEGRMVVPYGLEVTFDKTTHLIFPSKIRYVDLGSGNIMASEAEDAENVLRVKATFKDFETETNMSVICEDGSYYVFNVKYAKEPQKLSIEMKDFLSSSSGNLPTNRSDIYFKELGSESPVLVKLMMKTIHKENKRKIKHIGSKMYGMKYALRSIYAHNGLLYFNIDASNTTNIDYKVDFVEFKVVDKEIEKRTAIQEQVLKPLRGYNMERTIRHGEREHTVYVLEAFTLPDDKRLEITIHERGGSRNLTLYVENEDLLSAGNVHNLKLRF